MASIIPNWQGLETLHVNQREEEGKFKGSFKVVGGLNPKTAEYAVQKYSNGDYFLASSAVGAMVNCSAWAALTVPFIAIPATAMLGRICALPVLAEAASTVYGGASELYSKGTISNPLSRIAKIAGFAFGGWVTWHHSGAISYVCALPVAVAAGLTVFDGVRGYLKKRTASFTPELLSRAAKTSGLVVGSLLAYAYPTFAGAVGAILFTSMVWNPRQAAININWLEKKLGIRAMAEQGLDQVNSLQKGLSVLRAFPTASLLGIRSLGNSKDQVDGKDKFEKVGSK